MSSWWSVLFPLTWLGSTLVLSELRWFARRGPADRIRPYVVGGWPRHQEDGPLSVASFREVAGPLPGSGISAPLSFFG